MVYLATFVLAFATLALEILLSRLLSLTTWYHLAFFAISTAMLGMTAGAVRVFRDPERFAAARSRNEAARASLWFALITPLCLAVLCLIPIGVTISTMSVIALLITTVACALPFYFAGIALTLALTRSRCPIGRIYAADLVGAALGCLGVLFGLDFAGAPALILACAALGGVAAISYSIGTGKDRAAEGQVGWRLRTAALVATAGLGTAAAINDYDRFGVYPIIRKGIVELNAHASEQLGHLPGAVEFERWSALARISIGPELALPPRVWAPSPKLPPQLLPQRELHIDGGASTTIRRFHSLEDIEHLRYDSVNAAYFLRPNGGACILGLGGGKDAMGAILFGHERVVAVDVNPSIVRLLREDFRDFAGLEGREGVELIADDARSYVARTDEKFALIQMSLIDSWASTQAGAFTLSENALYTMEAWQTFLGHLKPGGIFTVSRFFDPKEIAETGRVISLAAAALLADGVEQPAAHVAMIANLQIATLLVSNEPLAPADIETLTKTCAEYGYTPVVIPGRPSPLPVLDQILAARTRDELLATTREQALNYDPPTDESPYFFNLLRLENLRKDFAHTKGVLGGNTMATYVLLALIGCLGAIAVLTILLPLFFRPRVIASTPKVRVRVLLPGALYFSAIGAGFMLAEIALIQRLSVFLGHPTYALGILLFGMILSTGLGSLLSELLPVRRVAWLVFAPLLAAGTVYALDPGLRYVIAHNIGAPQSTRIGLSLLCIVPLGLVLGTLFPTGMRLAGEDAPETPWFWALNGIFGVLCSAIAVFVSLYWSISTNFVLAAGCYAALVLPLLWLRANAELGSIAERRRMASDQVLTIPTGPLRQPTDQDATERANSRTA